MSHVLLLSKARHTVPADLNLQSLQQSSSLLHCASSFTNYILFWCFLFCFFYFLFWCFCNTLSQNKQLTYNAHNVPSQQGSAKAQSSLFFVLFFSLATNQKGQPCVFFVCIQKNKTAKKEMKRHLRSTIAGFTYVLFHRQPTKHPWVNLY